MLSGNFKTFLNESKIPFSELGVKKSGVVKIDSLTDARRLLFDSQGYCEELAETDKILAEAYLNLMEAPYYENFLLDNSKSFSTIVALSKLVQTNHNFKWLICTFFLKNRFDASWEMADTAGLSTEELEQVYNVFLTEQNKGVPLEQS